MQGCGYAAGGALRLDKQDSPAVQQLVTRELLYHPWACQNMLGFQEGPMWVPV